MIIEKASIQKFRGFQNVEFDLGSQLTVIAGQNGTQKTTVLGMLSQTFTISKDNPMNKEKPLCGGSFKSSFGEKFKLSKTFDKAKSHEWTLNLKNEAKPFVIESIARRDKKKPEEIRFWQKGTRSAGAGYIQLPVIYLSLKRLMPIGEDTQLDESQNVSLAPDEEKIYRDAHTKILLSMDKLNSANYLESRNKNTLGVTTDEYDWRQNSAGQDNIGKILLAILSFKRLQEKYSADYKGGILAIDEIDATLYPASQLKLVDALRRFSSKYSIQIIFTTHSLSILEQACHLQKEGNLKAATKDQIKVVFLEKKDNKIEIIKDVPFNTIKHRLNVTIEGKAAAKVQVFTEDKECAVFAKALLKRKASRLNFIDCTLGCGNYIELSTHKIPPFMFPNSIVILDGDIRNENKQLEKINKFKNYVILPSKVSPERLLANYLNNLSDNSPVWASVNSNFTKQYCFKDYTINEINGSGNTGRVKAKDWFKSHKQIWGVNAAKVINPWMNDNSKDVEAFIEEFTNVFNRFANELSIEKI